MIVNVRGTHGSGKSTIVLRLLRKYGFEVAEPDNKGRPLVYRVVIKPPAVNIGDSVFIIGRYDTACGGCDGIQPYDRIWPLVDKYALFGYNVLFEGALVSSSYGNIGRSSEVYGDHFVFAFLDTPLEVCLERIRQRRLAKGNEKPVEPTNTTFKFNSVEKSIPKIRDEFDRRVVMIDHTQPTRQVLKLFGVNIKREPL